MKEIKDNQFDVAITSPPYNRVRNDKYAHYDDVKNNYYKMIVDVTNELLREQQKYMGLYLSVLEKRALIENVEL